MNSNHNTNRRPKDQRKRFPTVLQQQQQQQRAPSIRRSRKSGGSAVSGLPYADTSTIVRMPQTPLFPARSKVCMLPYYTNLTLIPPVTGLSVSHVFSANGLYDPDVTATGTQPSGFDQMMVFYEHYTVHKVNLVATYRNYTNTTAPIVFLAARGDVTNIPDPVTVMQTGNSVSTQLLPGATFGALKELRMSLDVPRFLGINDAQDSTTIRGDVSANPSEGAFFHVGSFNNEVAAAGEVKVQIRLEYYAVFSEPRVITPSLARAFHCLASSTSDSKR